MNSLRRFVRSDSPAVIRATAWMVAILVMFACVVPLEAQAQATTKTSADVYQTLYLTNLTRDHDADEVAGALRNNVAQREAGLCRITECH